MLTDDLIKEIAVKVADEMMAALCQVDFSGCVDLAEYISSKNVEKSMRAVLAKAMPIPKQEPVAFGIYSENGDIRVWWRNQFDDQAVCNSKAKEWLESNGVDFSTVASLYDHPRPAQAAAIPECDCEKLQSRVRHLERLLMGL